MHVIGVLFDDWRIYPLEIIRVVRECHVCLHPDSQFSGCLALTGLCPWTRLFKPVSRLLCGCSSMVEHQLPKLNTRVRFPSPASKPLRELASLRLFTIELRVEFCWCVSSFSSEVGNHLVGNNWTPDPGSCE